MKKSRNANKEAERREYDVGGRHVKKIKTAAKGERESYEA